MIRRLRIRNFQSLADVDLELAPFTVIVGESNSGKSAVRRALAALVRNDPAGGRVRAGETKAEVKVDADDFVVTWEKGAGRNAYSVIEAGQDEVVYDKPGASVPEPVAHLLRLEADLHLATQFDPPFLLTESPSHAAKRLGGLTNIATLYEAIRESERQRKEAKKKASATSELAVEAEEELATYESLATESAKLHEISALLAAAHAADQEAHGMASSLAAARGAEGRVLRAQAQVAEVGPVSEQLDAVERARVAVEQAEALATAVSAARHHEIQAQPVAVVPDIDIDSVTRLVMEADALEQSYAKALAARRRHGDFLGQVQSHLAEEDRLVAALAEITTCPTCGQPMSHEDAA